MRPGAAEAAGAGLAPAALLRLASWLSPSFPTSAYAYSHGLEQLTADGRIADYAAFLAWARICLRQGAGWNDALLLCAAWRARADADAERLAAVAELARALHPSAERRRESLDQGAAFLRMLAGAWPEADPATPAPCAYAVAVGAAAASVDAPLAPTAALYLHSFCGALAIAGQKLVPLGQTDGQRAVNALNAEIAPLTARALLADLEDLGGAALTADIASMRHETLEVRLYRS